MNCPDARGKVSRLLVDAIREIIRLEIPVRVTDDPPNDSKDQPSQHETGGEGQDGVPKKKVQKS